MALQAHSHAHSHSHAQSLVSAAYCDGWGEGSANRLICIKERVPAHTADSTQVCQHCSGGPLVDLPPPSLHALPNQADLLSSGDFAPIIHRSLICDDLTGEQGCVFSVAHTNLAQKLSFPVHRHHLAVSTSMWSRLLFWLWLFCRKTVPSRSMGINNLAL